MALWDDVASIDAMRALAPEAFEALDRMCVAATPIDVNGPVANSRAVASYAEQFTMDVASMTADQRAGAASVLGEGLFGFLQATWVTDMADRIDQACAQLFSFPVADSPGRLEVSALESDPVVALWQSIDAFLPAVARLSALDPVTTEVIRLRGARAHDCHMCRSLRNVGALDAGADETTFDAIDRFEQSDLDPDLKVALRLVDATIWEPDSWPSGLATSVRRTFSPAEAVEIAFDVVRNAANRIAVALEADQANVTDGVEYFSTDESGTLTYGLARF